MHRVFAGLIAVALLQSACSSSSFEEDSESQEETISIAENSGELEAAEQVVNINSVELLGEVLFNDENLSFNRSQSCATCHDPQQAFIDTRTNAAGLISAVSLGDDEVTFGDRNSPSINYAALAPAFGTRNNGGRGRGGGGLRGGFFWDGRASSLAEQAEGPPLNPVEMGMPDKASVVARLLEDTRYIEAFQQLYGAEIFDDIDAAYSAMAQSIAAFEQTDIFMAFDSKYDRSLTGDYVYAQGSKARQGRDLFFSGQTNCTRCHQAGNNGNGQQAFTNFRYHNIGLPTNTAARTLNGQSLDFTDNGVLDNPTVTDNDEAGKFRVPTLRNVAVTGPYMHNGVFRELATVIKFYDHYHTNTINSLNPETGAAWGTPEVNQNLALNQLRDGIALSDDQVEALVCFLRTLTDAQYEDLIQENGVDCGEL